MRNAGRLLTVFVLFGLAQFAAGKEPVIDVHLHVWSEHQFPAPPHMNEAAGLPGAQSQEEMIAETVAQMDTNDVVLGLIHDDPANLELLRKEDPSRFWALPKISTQKRPDLARFGKMVERNEWLGIGEILTQYNGLEPTDAALWPYYKMANDHDLPVFWHSGLSFPGITQLQPKFRAELGRPLRWEEIFVKYPDMRSVLVHAGHPFLDEILAIMMLYPSVYTDTGAIIHVVPPEEFYRYYSVLIDAGLGDRIMFGSDQMAWPQSIGYGIDVMRNAPWDAQTKRDILYNNAARFLQLSEETIDQHHL
jgi:uncharacterized protein